MQSQAAINRTGNERTDVLSVGAEMEAKDGGMPSSACWRERRTSRMRGAASRAGPTSSSATAAGSSSSSAGSGEEDVSETVPGWAGIPAKGS